MKLVKDSAYCAVFLYRRSLLLIFQMTARFFSALDFTTRLVGFWNVSGDTGTEGVLLVINPRSVLSDSRRASLTADDMVCLRFRVRRRAANALR